MAATPCFAGSVVDRCRRRRLYSAWALPPRRPHRRLPLASMGMNTLTAFLTNTTTTISIRTLTTTAAAAAVL